MTAPLPTPPSATPLYRAADIRQLEAAARNQPLMERAGWAAADLAARLHREGPILILAGPGNNGGDAYVAARHLRARGLEIALVALGDPEQSPADASQARQRYLEAGGTLLAAIPDTGPWGLVMDGLFGIGLQRPLAGDYASAVAQANALASRDRCPLLALDCPSGLDGDTGAAPGPTIDASHTLTFIAQKPGLLTLEGPDHCGQVALADLELNAPALLPAPGWTVGKEMFSPWLQPRRRNSHKGSYGSVGILGGAPGMTGAALLAGRAALLLGSGRVFVGLADPKAPALDPLQAELMLRPAATLFAAPLTALAVGPGLGQTAEAGALLEQALSTRLPLVLDADGLNLLAADPTLAPALCSRSAPALLTPHPAEAARLLDSDLAAIQNDRIGAATAIARQYGSWVALKGAGTVIAAPDGRWWINTSGNPGQAAAGQGDILTGMAVSLLAQGWPPEAALTGAVHLHGAAADHLVQNGTGPAGLTASETALAAREVFNFWCRA